MRLTPSYRTFNIMNSQDQMSIYQELERKGYLNYAETANSSDSGVYGKMYELISQYNETSGQFGLPNTVEAKAEYLRRAEYRNTDWFKELFRYSVQHNHSVSMSGGTDKGTYYASLSVMDDPGWTDQSAVQRYTVNINVSHKIFDNLSASMRSNVSYRKQNAPGTLSSNVDAVNGEVVRDFDKWLDENYVGPYNIEFKYRYNINESDLNYYTVPADYDCAVIMAHLVKYICIDSYDEVAGPVFTRKYFPKMFFLIGEWEYLNNGTFILGTAEGGKKIMLSGVNYLPDHLGSSEELNHYYLKTIHHEFTHILNQTVNYPKDFAAVTADKYLADSWSSEPYNSEYLGRGFISAYAQQSDTEDFAEMLSLYVTNDETWWNSQLASAGDAAESIVAKMDIVRNYMQESFGIDPDKLRSSTILRREKDVTMGRVNLKDLSLK